MSRILIIDDDPLYAEVLADYLSMHNLEAVLVGTGTEGLRLIESENFSIILVDWQLPDMSGLQVIERLKSTNNTAPILVVTGLREKEALTSALDAGAADVLRKPFSPPQLLDRIKAICAKSGASAN